MSKWLRCSHERSSGSQALVLCCWHPTVAGASTYFKLAREYLKRTGHAVEDEKMAVIIQHITGSDHDGYWLPNISGVARSLDYYPAGSRTAEDGLGMLAFGMGKTIVDAC